MHDVTPLTNDSKEILWILDGLLNEAGMLRWEHVNKKGVEEVRNLVAMLHNRMLGLGL